MFTIGTGGLTVNGSISGTNLGISKYGTGTLTLAGANSYTGGTIVNGGTLSIAVTGSGTGAGIGAVSTGTPANNGTLDLGGSGGKFANTVSGSGKMTVGSLRVGAIITMTGSNTYTGGTTVNAPSGGTATLSGNAGSYGTGAVTVNGGATVDYTQSGTTGTAANNISGAGTASFGGNTGSANGTGGTINYTGSDSAAQTNVQSGTLMLANTTGPALSGPVAVATGATLQLGMDTQIAIVNPPSVAPVTAAVTLNGGTLAANGHNDGAINVNGSVGQSMGALSLGNAGTKANPSILDFGTGRVTLAFADSSSTLGGGYLNILNYNYTGGVDALYIGNAATLTPSELQQIAINGVYGVLQLSNGEIQPAAAPEPSGTVALLLGAGAVGGRIAARRRQTAGEAV